MLATFEVFLTRTRLVHRVPVELTVTAVSVPVKSRNDKVDSLFSSFGRQTTDFDGFGESTANIITKCDIFTIKVQKFICYSKRVFSPI